VTVSGSVYAIVWVLEVGEGGRGEGGHEGCCVFIVGGGRHTMLHVIQTLGCEVAFMFAAAQWISSWHWQCQDVGFEWKTMEAL